MEQNNSNKGTSGVKRKNSGLQLLAATTLNQTRMPLKETSTNLPSPVLKKAKISGHTNLGNGIVSHKAHIVGEQHGVETEQGENQVQAGGGNSANNASKSNRLEGEAFHQWQRSWRRIMKESIVYFDTQGFDSNNPVHQSELKRAQKALKQVECTIVPFYDREVTIIISRRQFDPSKQYAANDIFNDAHNLKIKVWNYDKVFRFLKNLGVCETSGKTEKGNKTGDLYNLLKEEKIFGSTDRDPNAKRDDLHYLEKNYLYVYDLSQNVRPIAVREWADDLYPKLHLTLDGKCPFISENTDNLEKKIMRRLQKFEATKKYRIMLKKATYEIMNNTKEDHPDSRDLLDTSTSTDIDKPDGDNDTTIVETSEEMAKKLSDDKATILARPPMKVDMAHAQPTLIRGSSCVQPLNNSNSKFYDVAASGYNGASNAAQVSVDSVLNSAAAQGNGLGPTVSQVPSRNLSNLKRRIIMKRHKQNANSQEERDKDMKPGYCENCRVKYNYFEDHINSNRHRNFASDDRNFKDIDRLIATLEESKSFGFITSNGDYKYSKV